MGLKMYPLIFDLFSGRGLRFSSSKEHVLEIFYHLSANTAEETILDRILPYIVSISTLTAW